MPALPAMLLAVLYILDRAWKMIAIFHFFRSQPPPEPGKLPSLSLIQPVTASPNDLRAVLSLRAQLHYPGRLEQVIVCDEQDADSQAVCREVMERFPAWKPRLALAKSADGVAMKSVKQITGVEFATGDFLCFVDDDILLREDTLAVMARHLLPAEVGAVFGIACYTNWRSLWGGLMSAFVNANALLNYIPMSYVTQPYTITGHLYALKRSDFDAIGGLRGMEERMDDDHELARRVAQAGLLNRQTPALYNVDNELPSLRAFLDQMKRWFVFPREMMMPGVSLRQQVATYLVSLPNLFPGLALLLAVWSGPAAWLTGAACLALFYAVYFLTERFILKESTPGWGWLLLAPVALVLPFQILFLLFSDNVILWRGKRYRVQRGGRYEIVG